MVNLKRLILTIWVTALIFGTGNVNAADKQIGQSRIMSSNVIPTPIQYTLPEPGMLTNHPFYFFKSFRDTLLELFIRDPAKKIEFTILQADKFLSMAIIQSSENQWNAVADSVNMSYKYSQKAHLGIVKSKFETGTYPSHLKENLRNSIDKHLEVIRSMQQKAPKESEVIISTDIDRYWTLLEDVKGL